MSEIIPAAPGWYVRTPDDPTLEPVLAWQTAVQHTRDGSDTGVLLPYIPNSAGRAPSLIPAESFERSQWEVVYLPETDKPLPKPPADINPGLPATVPCPVCKADVVYVRCLDRYVHEDGSDNRKCWLAVSRGEVRTW
ncbi:hypothetical protein HKX69_30035 [Streptomyces argyrophyllae]|uniref:Uncharacterized protein n=1 Tax=Streptomyces argyrophylli TaxID=2726118 RepID=A0A6M4PRE4_9ACTN|nr:hypothetical protein [Streptomyces argyrophyllae]QJS13219.1 hypothetical protein HKX69_30035 [Streptomyces argyrophyllae]